MTEAQPLPPAPASGLPEADDASLRLLVQRMRDGVFVAQDERLVFFNPALPAMLGWTPESFAGLKLQDILHEESREPCAHLYQQWIGEGPEPQAQHDAALRHRNGHPVWVEMNCSRLTHRGRRAVLVLLRQVDERRRAEAAVRSAMSLAQDTLDGLTAHICVLDERGAVVAVNRAWNEFGSGHGAAAERIGSGVNYLQICEAPGSETSDDAVRFAQQLREVLAGTRMRFDMQYPCETPEGLRWYVARVTRSQAEAPVRVIVSHEDVTAQVEAEHRIADLHQRMSMAVQGAGYGVWEYDLASDTLIWDELTYQLYGHTPETFQGSPQAWRACLHPEDREAVETRIASLMLGGRLEHFEYRILRASDGALRHVEASCFLQRGSKGAPQRLIGMNRDVTDQRAAESALRESEQRWKFALEGAGDGVWDWDIAAGTVDYSARWLEMLGLREDEVEPAPESGWSRVHPQDLPRLRAALQAHLEGRTRVYSGEMRMRRKDGSWKWFMDRGIVTARDLDGRPLRMVGVHTDLTERKQAELQRAELEVQLREAQKMDAVGTLAGGVAYDFNNVLAGILGNIELARQSLEAEHPAFANLEQIHRASLRARNLVQQILTFSRHQPQNLVVQPLRPVVEESLQLLRATLPTVVQIDPRLAEAPIYVRADATQIQQVLMNLCTNAWHALKGSTGRIEVGLEQATLDGRRTTDGMLSGAYAHLWVRDDGCGMDEAAVSRIFEPFYTTKPVGQGTGLGLSVVHGIVSTHEGAVAVDSAPGRGSTFHLYFPLAAAPAQVPARSPQPVRMPVVDGGGRRIMVVDDDPLMLITMEALLDRAGYAVTGFPDGPAAVAAAQADPQAFDLVISDYNMPTFSGLDVAREMARLRPELPVIISSGYLSDELRAGAGAAGVRRLLQKEHTVEELAAIVGQVLGEAAG